MKSRKRSFSSRKSRKRRRKRGGSFSRQQLLAYPIIPSMKFGCGSMDSDCKAARTKSKEKGNNSAYCQYVTPKLDAFVENNSEKCFSDKETRDTLLLEIPWQRAAQAKCISDEAVCPTKYPEQGYRAPEMLADIAEAEKKMGGKHGIFTGIVKDFGGNVEKAFAWLQNKQKKEMEAYQKATGANPQEGRGKRRKSRRKRRKSKKRKSRRKRKKSRRRRRR